jgi:enediyne biosynthesis protein E4
VTHYQSLVTNASMTRVIVCLFLTCACALPGCTGNPHVIGDPADGKRPPSSAPSQPVSEPPQPERPAGRLPSFVDVTAESGISFERYDDMRGQHRIMEATGGGVALFDYDGDGWLDVLLTDGCKLPCQPGDTSHASQLFRNLGDNRFTAVTAATFISCHGFNYGVATGDYDNDGFEDLYVAGFGHNSLWQNNGDGTFTEVTAAANADDPRWSSSAAFADFNRDGLLDLFVLNYVDVGDPPKLCPNKESPDGFLQCPPTAFPAVDDLLLLNDGAGRFVDITREAGITGIDGKGLSLAVFDANDDAWPDVYVANDTTANFLYINESAGSEAGREDSGLRFSEQGSVQGVALGREAKAQGSMGIACGDYDGDGWSDLIVTNFFAEGTSVYRNLGGKGFADDTNRSRLRPPTLPMVGFGADFLDFDNDGWLDLIMANGHIDDLTWSNLRERFRMKPQFFRNEGDRSFRDVSQWSGEYFLKDWLGRGLAVGDLDNDGDQDFVVSHQLAPSAVIRNDSAEMGSSVAIQFIGRESSRSAIGTRVKAAGRERVLVRQVLGGGSYQSAPDRRVHLGLGSEDAFSEVTATWPSGHVDQWQNITPGRYLAIEGRGLYPRPY